jgi:hypothetical protein
LIVAEVGERLAVSKQAAQKKDMERFNLKKLNAGDIKEQYQVTIRNNFAALEDLEDSGDINRAWDSIREIKISPQECLGYCESKHHKLSLMRNVQNWFIEGSRLNYSGIPSKVNEDNLTTRR